MSVNELIIHKICTKCKKEKTIFEFAIEKRSGLGHIMSRCKSCMAHFAREYYERTKTRRHALQKGYRENGVNALFKTRSKIRGTREWLSLKRRTLRCGAIRRKIPFNLAISDIEIIYATYEDPCPICGDEMVRPSVDRKDNNLGYVPGNCFLICYACNTGKNCLTPRQIREIYRYVIGDLKPSEITI